MRFSIQSFICGVLGFWAVVSAGCSENQLRPNIILVVTDDQGFGDLGIHGNPYIQTPNLDAFAKESLELTNFHVGTTCSPTRAGIMTGRNANRNNCWHTIGGCSILLEDEETMADVFNQRGYQTAMFGKWHLGDNYPFRPQDRGFETTVYHKGGGVGQSPDYWNNDYQDDTYFVQGEPEFFRGYCTDIWFDQAIDFLRQTSDKPFFMYLALNAAHGPFNVPQKYYQLYEKAPISERLKRFYGMITNIDDNFKRLTDQLHKLELTENTIVIFTTDNGTAAGPDAYNARLRGTKGSHYDGGHKVPFFVRWPQGNLLHGHKNDQLVAHVDLLPTLAELAGFNYRPNHTLDGTSVAKLFKDSTAVLDRMLVVDTQRNQWPEKGRNSCVMSSEWRLIDGKELYHIKSDPSQAMDLSTEYPERVKAMNQFYDDWWESILTDMQYAQIPFSDPSGAPVTITIHDLHTTEGLPWNQTMIRKAELSPKGYYSVEVVEEGVYQISMSRYPPESGLPINAQVEAIEPMAHWNGLPAGRAVKNITEAAFSLGDKVYHMQVKPDQPFASWEGELVVGEYQFSSHFVTKDSQEIPGYYHVIKKQ